MRPSEVNDSFPPEMREVFRRFVGDQFFLDRFAKSIVVADRPFANALTNTPAGAKLAIVAKETAFFRDWASADRDVLICLSTPDDQLQRWIGKHTRARALNVWRDWVLPRAAASEAGPLPDKSDARARTYSIVTLPRCASTFLCHRLQVAGLGRPREHIRPFLADLIERRLITPDELSHWWRFLTTNAQNGGLFGTKLIMRPFRRLLDALGGHASPAARAMLGEKIIRIRRDPLDVAVSHAIAEATDTWHVWQGDRREDHERAVGSIEIDDRQLVATYHRFKSEETALDALAAGFDGEVLELQFDALTADPDQAVAESARFLNARPQPNAPHWREPETWNGHTEVHERAAARLGTLLGEAAGRKVLEH